MLVGPKKILEPATPTPKKARKAQKGQKAPIFGQLELER